MPRIPKKEVFANDVRETAAQEEVTLVQEEAQAAQTAETSFFAADVNDSAAAPTRPRRERGQAAVLSRPRRPLLAGTSATADTSARTPRGLHVAEGEPGARDPALAPLLAELQAELPRLGYMDDQALLDQGTDTPAMLETISLASLRRATAALKQKFPAKAFTRQVEVAWVARVEDKLYAAAQKLEALELATRELNRGSIEAPKYYQLWDKHTESLRYVSSQQANAAEEGAVMGLGEAYFHQECLALLNEYALKMALAKHKNKIPDEHTLRQLADRLKLVASFASLEVRADLAQRGTPDLHGPRLES